MRIAVAVSVLLLVVCVSAQHPPAGSGAASGDLRCRVPDAPVAITPCEPPSIYTAELNLEGIEAVLNRHFDGFTIVPARGCWRRACEASLIIQVAGASMTELRQAAEEIRVLNKQKAVSVVAPGARRP